MNNFAAKAVLAATVTLAVAASPAMADIRYNSQADPLTAWQDGEAQAQMYGRFFVEDATYLRNNTNQRDPRPGGDAVYEETYYYYYTVCDGLDAHWCDSDVDSGPKTDTSDWYFQYDHDQLNPSAEKGRMITHVCEDHGFWGKDPCSISPVGTFSY
jgi:hypothetical protein